MQARLPRDALSAPLFYGIIEKLQPDCTGFSCRSLIGGIAIQCAACSWEEMATDKTTTSAPSNGAPLDHQTNPRAMEPAPVATSLVAVGDENNPLSDREMEVARLLVTGATNTEIARELIISPHTVKVHLRNIFDKLQVNSRTEASMVLLQRGWVVMPGVEPAPPLESDPFLRGELAPPLPEPEPLPDLAAQPQAWQLGIVLVGLAFCLVALILPTWLSRPKTTLSLLSDSGQTIVGQPGIDNLPRWEVRVPLGQPRSRLAAVQMGGQIYVAGGEGEGGNALDTVEVYDLDAGQWTAQTPLPSPRANLALAQVDGTLFAAGGSMLDIESPSRVLIYGDLWSYEPTAATWAVGGELPAPLAGAGLVAQPDALYLVGGWDGDAMHDEVWRLPMTTLGTATPADWEVIARLEQPMAFMGVTLVDQALYVVGGYDGRRELAGAGVLDLATASWQALPPLNIARGGLRLVFDGVSVLALGGGWTRTVQTHERYDIVTNQWISIASPIRGEWRHFAAASNDGSVYLLGGWSGDYLSTHLEFQSTFRALLPVIPNVADDD